MFCGLGPDNVRSNTLSVPPRTLYGGGGGVSPLLFSSMVVGTVESRTSCDIVRPRDDCERVWRGMSALGAMAVKCWQISTARPSYDTLIGM